MIPSAELKMVCRFNQCIHCKKGTARLDQLYGACRFLLFYRCNADQQPDYIPGGKIIFRKKNDPVPEDGGRNGYPRTSLHLFTGAGISSLMGNRHHFTWIGRRTVFIYHCRVTCPACAGRSDCRVYSLAKGRQCKNPEL